MIYRTTAALASVAIASLTWIAASGTGRTAELPDRVSTDRLLPAPDEQIAQLLFPPAGSDQPAIMVLGQGIVRVAADTAKIQLTFTSYDPYSEETEPFVLFQAAPTQMVTHEDVPPLTEAMLQPIIEAIVAAGVPADAIEVTVSTVPASVSYAAGSGEIAVTIDRPSREQVGEIVAVAAEAATDNDEIFLQNVGVRYDVTDCQVITQDVYRSAIADARSRATALATAMAVEIEEVPSVAESPFGLLTPVCGDDAAQSLPTAFPFGAGATLYDPNAPAEVEVRRDVFVTFPIR